MGYVGQTVEAVIIHVNEGLKIAHMLMRALRGPHAWMVLCAVAVLCVAQFCWPWR